MLAAGTSPSITKWSMSESYLLHFGIKHVEPEMEVGRPFIVARAGGKRQYYWPGITPERFPASSSPYSSQGYKGTSQRDSG